MILNSPHGSDEEVEDSDHGDADEDVQGPLDHGAVHFQPGEHPPGGPATASAALCCVPAAAVGGGGPVRHGGAACRFVCIIRCVHEDPAEWNQKLRQNP